jgi:hypothetical protein
MQLPRDAKPRTLTESLNLALPNTLIVEPSVTAPRRDKVLPRLRESRSDKLAPAMTFPITLIVLPNWTKFLSDIELPMVA